MTSRVVPVSAPGKIFLLGEYAVLGGGPALITTVDRHIHVRPRDDTDGYEVEGARFDDPLHLPLLIRQVLDEKEDLAIDANRLTVDVSEFYEDDTKLGLGSSAASTAAILASTAPRLSPERRFELGWEIHRRLQGGVGSGADIAASTFGGPLAYQLHELRSPFDQFGLKGLTESPDAVDTGPALIDRSKSLSLPEQVCIDAVWTGKSASSVSFVDAVADASTDRAREVAVVFEAIASAARAGIEAARNDDADQFIDAIRQGDRAMEELGALAEVPIITDTHRRIRALAHTTQAVAKPSGAGGGDFTLLVSPADAPIPKPIADDYSVVPVH